MNKLFIVDNNASFRQVLIAMLGTTAREYIECQDGLEAIKRYAHHLPDMVLMDFEMRSLDGIEVTRRIKERFPEAQILIYSLNDDAELRLEAELAGACGFLLKDDFTHLHRFLEAHSHLLKTT